MVSLFLTLLSCNPEGATPLPEDTGERDGGAPDTPSDTHPDPDGDSASSTETGATGETGSSSVTVCHRPTDDPNTGQTTEINALELAGHLAHGDYSGLCHRDGIQVIIDEILAGRSPVAPAPDGDESGREVPVVDPESSVLWWAHRTLQQSADPQLTPAADHMRAALEALGIGDVGGSARHAADAIDVLQALVDAGALAASDLDTSFIAPDDPALLEPFPLAAAVALAYRGIVVERLAAATAIGGDALRLQEMRALIAAGDARVRDPGGAAREWGGAGDYFIPFFDIALFEQNLIDALDQQTVGYAYTISAGGELYSANSLPEGYARHPDDAPARDLDTDTLVNIASVTKPITAAAIMQLIEADGTVTVDSPIAPYLPPDWSLGPSIGVGDVDPLTFRDLLSQESGLSGEDVTYEALEGYIAAGITSNRPVTYLNSNFAMMRVLLPRLWGILPWTADTPPDVVHAAIYIYYVQNILLAPMGIDSGSPAPEPDPSLLYNAGEHCAGIDAGDWTLRCGGGGLWMSAQDIGAFLAFRRYDDSVLSESTRTIMDDGLLGWRRITGNGAPMVTGDHGVYLVHDGRLEYDYPAICSELQGMDGAIMAYPNQVEVALLIPNILTGRANMFTLLEEAFDDAWVLTP